MTVLATYITQTLKTISISASQFGDGFREPGSFFADDSKAGTAEALGNLELFVSRMIGGLTILGGIFFIIYFVLGAFTWITAGGDSSKIQKSRDQMVQGVLGLIVIVIAYSIVGIVGTFVGFDLLTPAQQIENIFDL